MKQVLLFTLLSLLVATGFAQTTYNPALHTVSNKPYGMAQAGPTDARSYYYDAPNFKYRAFQSTAEVLSYLNLAKYRTGQFPIIVHSGGTLLPDDTYTSGVNVEYWFKDGVSDADLTLKTALFGLQDVSSNLNRHVNLNNKHLSIMNADELWLVSGTDSSLTGAFGELYMKNAAAFATFDAAHRNYTTISAEADKAQVKMASIGTEAKASLLHVDTTLVRLESYDTSSTGSKYGTHLDLTSSGANVKFRWDSGLVTRSTVYIPHAYGTFYMPLTINNTPADQWGNINLVLGGGTRFAVPGEDDFATADRTFKLHGHMLQINPDATDTVGDNTRIQFREAIPFNAYWRDPDNLYVANLGLAHDVFNAVISDAGGVNGSIISAQRHHIELREVTDNGLASLQLDGEAFPAAPVMKLIYTSDTHDFDNTQSFSRNVSGDYTIPLTVNSIAADAAGNIAIPYADSTLGVTGLVSDTTQYFRGEKGIVSYSDLLFEAYSEGTLRTILASGGGQTWFLNDGSAEVGRVKYTTPVGTPGIGFYNTSGTGRSQIRQYLSTGGIAIGSETGSASFAGNQFVQLPTGSTFIQASGAGPVTDVGYLFNVAGSAKIDDVVKLPHYANNVSGDSVLATDNTGLVKNVLLPSSSKPIVTITSSTSFASYNTTNASYIIYNNTATPYTDVLNNKSSGIYQWDASTGDYNGLTGKWQLVAVAPSLEMSGTTKAYWHTPALQIWKNYAEGDATHPPTFMLLHNDVADMPATNTYLNGAMISGNGYGGAIVFHAGFSNSSNRRLRLGLIDNSGVFIDGLEVHYASGNNTLINSMTMVPATTLTQNVGSTTLAFGGGYFGGLTTGYVTKSTDYTTTATNYSIDGDATSAQVNITLGSSLGSGKTQLIRKTDAGANKVVVVGTINGATNYNLNSQYDYVLVQYNGTNWNVVASGKSTAVYTDQANTYTAGMKQTFQASASTAGVNFAGVSSDPSSPANGDLWNNTTSFQLKYRANGTTRAVANLDEAQTLTNKTIAAGSNTLSGITNTNLSGTAAISYGNLQSVSAYKMLVNNTASSATVAEDDFKHVGQQVYTGTIVWDGTAPSGTTSHVYNWTRVGNMVTLYISVIYGTVGATNSTVTLGLPADVPAPVLPTGTTTAATAKWYPATGYIDANVNGAAPTARASLQADGASGWRIAINVASTVSAKMAQATVTYFTN